METNEVKVRRGNVTLRVPEEQTKEYLAKGFDVIGKDGKVVQASVPNDINILKKAYVEHLAKIADLEKQVAELSKPKTTAKKESTPAKKGATKKAE